MDERADGEEQIKGRMWGVFNTESEMGTLPISMFRNEHVAHAWVEENAGGDMLGVSDYDVIRTDIHGTVWNSIDPDPKAGGFEPFTPEDD